MTDKPLKLLAKDGEDIEVISAVLQDAIVPLEDMTYEVADKNFIMVVHRFCWCDGERPKESFERVCCAVSISGVRTVQVQGIDLSNRSEMLELLAVFLENNSMQFVFSGESRIKLELEDWTMKLEDFGEPWPTTHQPCHT
ncbi:MAG: DUF2948 family protein [Alphaproteobacteria bacterium]|nr:DUF2948 family protein [Alphaproteobacteria bacterium]